jgi:hypothetical protein
MYDAAFIKGKRLVYLTIEVPKHRAHGHSAEAAH